MPRHITTFESRFTLQTLASILYINTVFQLMLKFSPSGFSLSRQRGMAKQALNSIGGLYGIERQASDMSYEDGSQIPQEKAAPLIKTLHVRMLA